jgi:hypothetical protein
MKIRLTQNWRNRKAGDLVEGKEAAAALTEKVSEVEGRKPSDRAEKRPKPGAERR